MKKLGKILLLVLSLALVLGVFAVAAFADSDPFYVDNLAQATWEDAYANADENTPIILAADYTVTNTLSIGKSLTVNLGGKTLSASADVFEVTGDGVTVNIVGPGTVVAGGKVLTVGEGATVNISGGITVNSTATATVTLVPVSGKLFIEDGFAVTTNVEQTGYVECFDVFANAELHITDAEVSLVPSKLNASSVADNYSNRLIESGAASLVDAVNSKLTVVHGRVLAATSDTTKSLPATMNFLRSEISSSSPYGTGSNSSIYTSSYTANLTFTDCSVISGGRAIGANQTNIAATTETYVTWNNSNYSVPDDAKYGSPRLFCDGVNAVVRGGVFDMSYGSTTLTAITVRTRLWDGKYGVLIGEGTRFTSIPVSEITSPTVDGDTTYYYNTASGSYNTNFSLDVVEGVNCVFVSETVVNSNHELESYYAVSYPRAEIIYPERFTVNFESIEVGTESPSAISVGWKNRTGSGTTVKSADGKNTFYEYKYESALFASYPKTKDTTGKYEASYIGIDLGDCKNPHPNATYLYDYITVDFDLASTVVNEYGLASYGYAGMGLFQRDGSWTQFQTHTNKMEISGNSGSNAAAKFTLNGGSAELSTVPGEWNHFTLVVAVDNSTVTDEEGNIVSYNLTNTKIYVYVNGEYVGWTDAFKEIANDPASVKNVGLDEFRFAFSRPSETMKDFGVALDNFVLAYYSEGYVGDVSKLVSDSSKKVTECTDMVFGLDYQFSSPNTPVANVDGKDYYMEEGVIANIKEGSVLTLNSNLETPIPELEFTIKTNGYSFINTSENYYTYQEDEASDIWYVKYATNKVVIVWDPDDEFGLEATTEGTLNSTPAYPANIEDRVDLVNKKMQVFLGWSYEGYGMTEADTLLPVTQKDINDEEICLYPVFIERDIIYTLKNEKTGEISYYSELPEDGNALAEILAAAVGAVDTDATLTLYSDMHFHEWTKVTQKGNLSIDLNGCTLAFTNYGDANDRLSLFAGSDSTWFNLYSSKPGGALLNYTYYVSNQKVSSSAILGGGNANFGKYVNEERGINADGDNLTVHTTILIDHYGHAISENNLTTEQPYTTINIIGGTYKRTHSDSMGLLIMRKYMNVTVEGANLIADSAPIFANDPRNTAKSNVTVNNSYLYSSGNLLGMWLDISTVTITNTVVDAAIKTSAVPTYDYANLSDALDDERNASAVKGKVVFGEGAILASGRGVETENLVIADGCFKVAISDPVSKSYPANTIVFDKMADGSYVCNESSFVFTEKTVSVVPQFKVFADNGGEIANLEWYDENGNLILSEKTIIGDNVRPVPDGSKLGVIEGNNGWYDLGYTKYVDELGNDASEIVINEAKVYKFYPVMTTPVADLNGIKYNLTTYSYFQSNIYIPTNTPENVSYVGTFSSEACTASLANGESVLIKGESYKMYNDWPGVAHQRTKWIFVKYIVTLNGESYELVYSLGIDLNKYAESVLASDEMSLKAKTLIANMVNYANETIKLLEGAYTTYWANAMTLAADYITAEGAYDEIIANTPAGTAPEALGEYITGASFLFGDYQPRFAFKYDSVPNAENGNEPSIDASKLILPGRNGAVTISETGIYLRIKHTGYAKNMNYAGYHYAYDKDGNSYTNTDFVTYDEQNGHYDIYAMSNNTRVFDFAEIITVTLTVDGVEVASGTYSLADYIKYQESIADSTTGEYTEEEIASAAQAVKTAKALYAYAMASSAYVKA